MGIVVSEGADAPDATPGQAPDQRLPRRRLAWTWTGCVAWMNSRRRVRSDG